MVLITKNELSYVIQSDACEYLQVAKVESIDLFFSDILEANDMSGLQKQENIIENFHRLLTSRTSGRL